MSSERDYITQEQQTSLQPNAVESRPANERKPSRIRLLQVGTLTATMLATGISFMGAESAEHNKVKIEPQAQTDILEGVGTFDMTPLGWNAEPTDIVPTLEGYFTLSSPSAATVETDNGVTGCQSNGWITTKPYSVNPNNVYTLEFFAVYDGSKTPNGINPQVILDWKDSQGQTLHSPSIFNGQATNAYPSGTWGNQIIETFGPGQNMAIPSQAGEVTVELKAVAGNPSITCTGTLIVDNLQVMGPVAPNPTPTPTRAVSVGGFAEQVNPNDLQPIANNSGSNNTELEVVIGGIVIGSLAAAGAGWKIRSMSRERNK